MNLLAFSVLLSAGLSLLWPGGAQSPKIEETADKSLQEIRNVAKDTRNRVRQLTSQIDSLKAQQKQLKPQSDKLLKKIKTRLFGPASCDKSWSPVSGVTTLLIGNKEVPAYCDQHTDGGGWTVIQRRKYGTSNFNRTWEEYEEGFGDLNSDFWFGLKNIHQITTSGDYLLRVDLHDFDKRSVGTAWYKNFYIDGPDKLYRLHISAMDRDKGNMGDSLHYHNNMNFSTPDNDNDMHKTKSCAAIRSSGWWFKSCLTSNLNGVYNHTAGDSQRGNINWRKYHWSWRSYMRAQMRIRPSNLTAL